MKKKNGFMRAAVLLTAAMLLAVPASPVTDTYAAKTEAEKAKIEAAQQKKKTLEQERKKTAGQIEQLNALKSDVSAYITKLDGQIAAVDTKIAEIGGNITVKEGEIQEAGVKLSEAEAEAARQYDDMKLRIKYMYEKGSTGFLDMLLSSNNMTEFFNHSEYVEKISEYDRKQLDAYEETVNAVEEQKTALENEKAALEVLKTEEEANRESLQTLISSKQNELAKYKAQIADAQSDLEDMDLEIAAQEKEIKAVEAAIKKREAEEKKREEEAKKKAAAEGKTYTTKSLGSIKFRWPCPASGRISSGFGKRNSPKKGASSYHQGLDIGASSGSAIVAAADGEVVTATYSSSAGNYIMLSHGGGVYSVYMHCSKLNVSVGQKVSAGQTIAAVGSTGISTGPHLHFGIRSGGSYVDPSAYVHP